MVILGSFKFRIIGIENDSPHRGKRKQTPLPYPQNRQKKKAYKLTTWTIIWIFVLCFLMTKFTVGKTMAEMMLFFSNSHNALSYYFFFSITWVKVISERFQVLFFPFKMKKDFVGKKFLFLSRSSSIMRYSQI